MKIIVPEINEIVNFYSSERIGEIARETGFARENPAWRYWENYCPDDPKMLLSTEHHDFRYISREEK